MLEAGNPYSAIPRLRQIIAKYPDSKVGVEARFVLGHTYYEVNSLAEAYDSLTAYIDRVGEWQHAAEAREILARLEKRERHPAPGAVDSRIQSLRAEIEKGDESAETRMALADLLWRQKRYEESARAYVDAIRRSPNLAGDEVLARRVEFGADGGYTALTPSELIRRDRENDPLRIFNVTAFPAERDRRTLAYRRYVVAGQATNRSSAPLRNVEVHATLYGFGNAVYDTRTQRIGTLKPGQIRAFSLRLANFDDLNRIERHECVGTFER